MGDYGVSVPATSANLGPGYDTLGLALDLRLEVRASVADSWSIRMNGEGVGILPQDETNLILATYRRAAGLHAPVLHLEITNPIPISRGLGSSATAIVAALALAQLATRGELDRHALFQEAARVEGHPDNVAPAVYGGLRICSYDNGLHHAEPGQLSPQLRVALVSPEIISDTNQMRGILPKSYPDGVLDQNRRYLDKLLQGLANGDPEGLKCSELDQVHQPYRFEVQPISKQIYQFMQTLSQIKGAFLSGSGATVGGWVLDEDNPVPELLGFVQTLEVPASCRLVRIDHQGVLVL